MVKIMRKKERERERERERKRGEAERPDYASLLSVEILLGHLNVSVLLTEVWLEGLLSCEWHFNCVFICLCVYL